MVVVSLGKIAAVSVEYRDMIVNSGVLKPLVAQLGGNPSLYMTTPATLTLSILCSRDPAPPFELTSIALPTLAKLIDDPYLEESMMGGYETMLSNVCLAFSNLSKGTPANIQAILDTGILPRLFENITNGDDSHKEMVIKQGAIPIFIGLLEVRGNDIKEDACMAIANLAAGNIHQIQSIIDANVFQTILPLLYHGNLPLTKYALLTVLNATQHGSPKQIDHLVDNDIIPFLCLYLDETKDQPLVNLAIDSIQNILKVGALPTNHLVTKDQYLSIFRSNRGVEKTTELTNHINKSIRDKAHGIINKYLHI
eukprot:gene4370-5109_t